jgi:hypothetical protein
MSEHPEERKTAPRARERENQEKLILEKIDPQGRESKEGFTPERYSERSAPMNP